MKYRLNFDHWTVLHANGHKSYWKTEEAARAYAVLYGIGLTAPLYAKD